MATSRTIGAAFLGVAAVLFMGGQLALAADSFPSQTVRLVVAWPPGGSTDVFSRALAQKLSERWKRGVIVENRPGASGVIGATYVANAKPDGHTLLMATDQELLSNQFLFSQLSYSPTKSFAPITRVLDAHLVLIVRSDSPYQNVAQLVDAAKRAPGKLTFASNGPGSHLHVAMNWFAMKAGIELTHVPYKGGAPAIQAVMAGDVDMTAVPLSAVEPFLKSNNVRALAVTAPQRLEPLAAVPTLKELGYDVDYSLLTVSIVAPANTPRDVTEKIARDVKDVMADRAFRAEQADRYGYITIVDTPTEFANYLVTAAPLYRARIEATNVKLD